MQVAVYYNVKKMKRQKNLDNVGTYERADDFLMKNA